jgi:hypothetical protein
MGWNRENRSAIEDAVRLKDNFEHTHAHGERHPRLPIDPGRLHPDHAAMLLEEGPEIEYVVFSYTTPIAWVLTDGKPVVVDQYFSNTTSTLQALIRREWGCNKYETVPAAEE